MKVDLQKFLLTIRQHGGESTTTNLKASLGLSSSQIHYRYQLAGERDFIETFQPGSDNGKPEPKVVSLTQEGDEWIRERSSSQRLDQDSITVSRVEMENLHNRIDELEQRLNAQDELIQRMRRVVNASIPYVRQLRAMIRAEHFDEWDGETIEDWDYDFEY